MMWRPIVAALAVMLFDCASLEPLPIDTCGNGIVEAGEDCDVAGTPPSDPNRVCGARDAGAKACRFTCKRERGLAPTCPAGWGCGVDEICREAAGTFSDTIPLSGGAITLRTGDFDGDGRVDIVGGAGYRSAGGARVHYFDQNGQLATTTPIDAPLTLPIIRDLNDDGRDDIGFATFAERFGGFAVLSGGQDRTFTPLTFPTVVLADTRARAAVVNVSPRTLLPVQQSSCLIALTTEKGATALRSFCGADLVGIKIASYNEPVTEVVPGDGVFVQHVDFHPVVTPPREGDPSCGAVAVVQVLRPRVMIASPCKHHYEAIPGSTDRRDVAEWSTDSPLTIDLPGAVIAPPIAADVDGDGADDVVLYVKPLRGDPAYVYLTHDNLTPRPATDFFPAGPQQGEQQRLLGALDLDGDQQRDFVTRNGVFLGRDRRASDAGAVAYDWPPAATPRTESGFWQQMRVARVNGDAAPDVVLMSAQALDIDVLINDGAGRFTSFTVRSDKVVRAVTTGDYDGDAIDDIAFLQSSSPLELPGAIDADLLIAYGRASGGPEPPRLIARFEHARAIYSSRAATSAIESIIVAEEVREGEKTSVRLTGLLNSSGRQPVSPLYLNDGNAQVSLPASTGLRFWQPTSLAVGAVRPGGAVDVFAFAAGLELDAKSGQVVNAPFLTSTWRASYDKGTKVMSPFLEELALTDAIVSVDRGRFIDEKVADLGIVTVVGNLDPPGAEDGDELVSVARTPSNEVGVFVIDAQPAGGKLAPKFLLPGAKLGGGDPIGLADVDEDGRRDLVIIVERDGARRLLAFLNDGKHGFAPGPIELSIPGASDAAVAFSSLRIGSEGGGTRTELAVATRRGLVRARLKDDKQGFTTTDLTPRLRPPSAPSSSPLDLSAVACGDVDGDGTDDIVVADGGSLRVLRQSARLR